MKKIFSGIIVLCTIVFLQMCVFSEYRDIDYYVSYKTIEVKGKLENKNKNNFVTAILRDGEKLVNISEAAVNSDGTYKIFLKAPQTAEELSLSVRYGDENVSQKGYDVLTKETKYMKLPYEVYEKDGQYHISYDLSRIREIADRISLIAAQYDADGTFKDCKVFDLENMPAKYSVDVQKIGELKLFVWADFERIIPAAELSENGGAVTVSFGTDADNQVRDGYSMIAGDNNYKRYKNAVSEIPEEFNVISEQKPQIERSIYVSPDGDDNGDGSINTPYRTINRALSEYSALTADQKEEWTGIYLRGGTYNITEEININKTMTGIGGDARLYIGAYDNEKVYIKNTSCVGADKLEKVTAQNTDSSIIGRINKGVENLYYCTYSDLGISKMPGYSYGNEGVSPILLYNGKKAEQSRYPDFGETYIEKVTDSGCGSDGKYTDYAEFVPVDKKPFSWAESNEIKMGGQICVSWYYNRMQAFVDKDAQTVKVPANQALIEGTPCSVNLSNSAEDKSHFYYYNVFEEISLPGEWCSSDAEQRLYIYPPNGQTDENDTLEILGGINDYAFNISEVKNVVVDNINFTALNKGINIDKCENVVAQNCSFDNIHSNCANISQSTKCGIIGTDFTRANMGVVIKGANNYISDLVPSRNFVQDCYFNTVNNTCIYISTSCGNVISHNTGEKYTGIFTGVFGGCENVIECNETYAGGTGGNEMYPFYINGWYSSKYNHIRNNYIHDNSPDVNEIKLAPAMYLDDMGEDNFVYGNVFENLDSGLGINGGDNNIVDSNTFINCNSSAYSTDHMYAQEKNFGRMINSIRMAYSISSDAQWSKRYRFTEKRGKYIKEIASLWNNGDHSSDKVKFAIGSTGNYFINNKMVDSPSPAIGIYYKEYYTTENPEEGVTQFDGNDYSVMYNNTAADGTSDETAEKIGNAGIRRSVVYSDSGNIDFLYPVEDTQRRSDNKIEVCWKNTDCVDYYKIVIAEDSAFENIVEEKWINDCRYSRELQTYPSREAVYYYRVEAYNFANSRELVGKSNVRTITFDKYKQTENKIIISSEQSNNSDFWRGAVGNEYVRKFDSNAYTEQGNDYVSFNTSDNSKAYRYIRNSTDEYRSAESILNCCAPDTTVEVSMQIMIPDENSFGEYIDIPHISFSPWKYASSEAGKSGQSLYFRIKKSGDEYIIYRGVGNVPNTMPALRTVGRLTKDDLFGKWIDINISVNMKDGTASGSFGNVTAEFEINGCTEYTYQWNSESFLRHFDIAVNPIGTNNSKFYVRNAEAVRKPITD